MLIVALVLAVIGLAALVTAVVTSNELVAWVCIGASGLGVLLLIVDAIRERAQRRVPGVLPLAATGEHRMVDVLGPRPLVIRCRSMCYLLCQQQVNDVVYSTLVLGGPFVVPSLSLRCPFGGVNKPLFCPFAAPSEGEKGPLFCSKGAVSRVKTAPFCQKRGPSPKKTARQRPPLMPQRAQQRPPFFFQRGLRTPLFSFEGCLFSSEGCLFCKKGPV